MLQHLEHHRTEGESLAVPVKLPKNGSLAKSSRPCRRKNSDHDAACGKKSRRNPPEHLKRRDEGLAIQKRPETGCDYCKYRHVCGFDVKVPDMLTGISER